eukprot:CAMPEP_0115078080 /NCGR_PEP_ID=MMETSP0227-20121206/17359_1 /TAXON_ID=89957 /ORGANISM="Polarella glacialis, Strain CCMP 1383" /LENGTH=447 /DNA_ID=CAMNT_0002465443 /DNA_START=51 /DNA_END=1394 /DNA_ORIENTATION=-
METSAGIRRRRTLQRVGVCCMAAICVITLGTSDGAFAASPGTTAPKQTPGRLLHLRPQDVNAFGHAAGSAGSSVVAEEGIGRVAAAAMMLAAGSLAARAMGRPTVGRGTHGLVQCRAENGEGEGEGEGKGGVQQLLGMKGAGDTADEPLWKIRLQLCKPVTWPPLIFGVIAGVCASGNFDWSTADSTQYAKLFLCVLLSGPVLVGFTQTLNDWYDRDLDAINEPYRPIPSGRITEAEVWQQIWFLGIFGLTLAGVLDIWQGHTFPQVFLVAVIGVIMAYIYSAPPLKLKQNWLSGCYALGSSYIALPWWAGQSTFGEVTPEIVALTLWYSIAAIGIAIVNDFKSIKGDTELGLESAPVVFGVDTAKLMAPLIKDLTQLTIVAYLLYIGETNYAITLFCLIIPQVIAAKVLFLDDPLKNDVKYQGASLPFFSIGTIVAASAIGGNLMH